MSKEYTLTVDVTSDRDEGEMLELLRLMVQLARGEDLEVVGAAISVYRDAGELITTVTVPSVVQEIDP